MKENRNIGDLIKERLESYEDNDINQDWLETELKLHKLKFLKFSLTNFNVYYCSFILATFALTSTVFIKTFFFNNNIQLPPETTSSVITDSLSNNNHKSAPKVDLLENSGEESSQNKNNKNEPDLFENKTSGIVPNNPLNKKETSSLKKTSQQTLSPKQKINNNQSSTNTSTTTNKTTDNNTKTTTTTADNIVPSIDKPSINSQPGTSSTNTVKDNLNLTPSPKKNVIYITKQDTIEVYDTLRRKKPFKKR